MNRKEEKSYTYKWVTTYKSHHDNRNTVYK